MFGFLKNIHDQSGSELDDFEEKVRREIQSLYSDETPREGRVRTGVASKRTIQRYLNATSISDSETDFDSEEVDKQIITFNPQPVYDKGGPEFFDNPDKSMEILEKIKQLQREKSERLKNMSPLELEEYRLACKARYAKKLKKREAARRVVQEESARLEVTPEDIQDRLDDYLIVDTVSPTDKCNEDDVDIYTLPCESYVSLLDPVALNMIKRSISTSIVNSFEIILSLVKFRVVPFTYSGEIKQEIQKISSGDLKATSYQGVFIGKRLVDFPIQKWLEEYKKAYQSSLSCRTNNSDSSDSSKSWVVLSNLEPAILPYPETFELYIDSKSHISQQKTVQVLPGDTYDIWIRCFDAHGSRLLKSLAQFHQVNIVSYTNLQKDLIPETILNDMKQNQVNLEQFTMHKLIPRIETCSNQIFIPHIHSLREYIMDRSS